MRLQPTAFGWIDTDVVTSAPAWDLAQMRRLCRRLGYALLIPDVTAVRLIDQIRAADVDAVVIPTLEHLDPLTINNLMHLADIEVVTPRMSFTRWSAVGDIG